MIAMPLYLKPLVVLIASLVFPPAGLVLLWMRPRPGAIGKSLLSVPVIVLGIAHLFLFYGLTVELYGGGTPHLRFERSESHEAAVEASRAAQPRVVPASTQDAAAAEVAPAPVASVEPGGPAGASSAVSTDAETPAASPSTPTATATATATANASPAGSTYWSDFRGPQRLGHYDQQPILQEWPAGGLQRLWKQPSGGGYASFTIAHGTAFTIEQRREQEVVAAYDITTGRERWTSPWGARFRERMGGDGPRATPVWSDGKVYALGATGEFRCLDAATGKTIWRKNIIDDNGARNLQWGMAASPLVVDDAVIVQPGGPNGRSIVAYHKGTGERMWSALDDKAAYTSAVQVTLDGRPQLLTMTASRAVGLSPADGSLLWEYPWVTQYGVNAVEPIVVGRDQVFLTSGYGKGAALLRLTPQGDRYQAVEVWSNKKLKAQFNGPVIYDGHVYGLDDGILACLDVATGEQKWKGGRYGYGQVLLASGHLVVLTEEGELVLVRATPEKLDERARFSAISGKTWNYPAISDGVLLVRNEEEMAAFQIGAP
jgi:outer membrane protein assembly factor BamB